MTAIESFREALKKLIDTRGHGAQAELADALLMHRSAINDMLTGRRGASSKMQERIAAHFGLTLGEMLRIGEGLMVGRVVFPWADQLEGLDRCDQLMKIIDLTNKQVGCKDELTPFLRRVCAGSAPSSTVRSHPPNCTKSILPWYAVQGPTFHSV